MKLIGLSALASIVLVAVYLAAGGGSYSPAEVRDPCDAREWREPDGLDELGQQLALSGIDGAACELGVTRESLARALATEESRQEFMDDNSIDDAQFEAAVRAGLNRMITDAENAGAVSGLVALGLRALARVVPAQEAFMLLQDARPLIERGLGAAEGLERFEGDLGDSAEDLDRSLDQGLDGVTEGLGGLGETVEGIQGAVDGLLDSLSAPSQDGESRDGR